MAYTAWSVVFGEQPTAAKWNQLGANDAGFRDGSNFSLNNNVIPAAALATNAILLGSTKITANISTTSTSMVDATGITSTVTVPAGGRSVLVMFEADRWACSTTGVGIYAQLLCDGVVIGTFTLTAHNTANGALPLSFFASNLPAAGSRVYKLQWKTDGGTLTMTASATSPAQLLVLAI